MRRGEGMCNYVEGNYVTILECERTYDLDIGTSRAHV